MVRVIQIRVSVNTAITLSWYSCSSTVRLMTAAGDRSSSCSLPRARRFSVKSCTATMSSAFNPNSTALARQWTVIVQ